MQYNTLGFYENIPTHTNPHTTNTPHKRMTETPTPLHAAVGSGAGGTWGDGAPCSVTDLMELGMEFSLFVFYYSSGVKVCIYRMLSQR